MNNNSIFLDELPHSVEIGGLEVEIKSDFKTSIKFAETLRDNELEENEKVNKALFLYYPILENTTDNSSEHDKQLFIHIKDNLQEAISKMLWFYRCGEEAEESKQGEEKQVKVIFSYSHDYKAMVSDFKREYNTNLLEETLHWWTFKTFFNGLSKKSEISERMRIRSIDITKVPKEQVEYYKAMKKLYEIPRDIKEIEEEDEFDKMMMSGGDIAAFIKKE